MTDSLVLWDAAVEEPLEAGFFDWGSVARRSSADLFFCVANTSLVYTALGVSVNIVDTGSVASPSQAAMHLLSLDEEIFTASVSLGDLEPATVSHVVNLRRVVPAAAPLGTWTFQILAQAQSFIPGPQLPAVQTVL